MIGGIHNFYEKQQWYIYIKHLMDQFTTTIFTIGIYIIHCLISLFFYKVSSVDSLTCGLVD